MCTWGEAVAPYATLNPLTALLPLKRDEGVIPAEEGGIGGIRIGGLGQRMRKRWQTMSDLWEKNRGATNDLNLLGRLDYHRELSAQLEWMRNPAEMPVRVVYTQGGEATAALLTDSEAIVESRLYWIVCKDTQEAHYLLAIINSDTLADAVNKYTTANWAGKTRDLHKHLWKLTIPEFDPGEPLHMAVSEAGRVAEEGAASQLPRLREDRDRVTVTVARRELRKWLRQSPEGQAVEAAVRDLLGNGHQETVIG